MDNKSITIPLDVYKAIIKACVAIADHQGDACWQSDFFRYRDLARIAVNAAEADRSRANRTAIVLH